MVHILITLIVDGSYDDLFRGSTSLICKKKDELYREESENYILMSLLLVICKMFDKDGKLVSVDEDKVKPTDDELKAIESDADKIEKNTKEIDKLIIQVLKTN